MNNGATNELAQGGATQGVNHYSGPDYASVPKPWLEEQLAEIRRLRARVAELEAGAAITFGTLERPPGPPDGPYADGVIAYGTVAPPPRPADMPTVYSHNVPPSAPPHETPSNPVKPRQTETSHE
ncbi:MAG TPA: hypothetical protein VMQ99_04155 [Acetobacteraceae bacterium]|nr:hypothetical protein [Acetobacteraceae bacterium]